MGLSNFPSAAEGVLPVLVMNTVLSVTLLKNMVRSLLQVVGAAGTESSSNLDDDDDDDGEFERINARERRISITQFKSLCQSRLSGCDVGEASSSSSSSSSCSGSADITVDGGGCGSGSSIDGSSGGGWAKTVECCVCLCGFEADEEVSELSCKHFFHKGCLEKWFDNKHSTCPLCRSIH